MPNMIDLAIQQFQMHNKERNKVWDPEAKLTPLFFAVELAGEVGEACNIVKKLERERDEAKQAADAAAGALRGSRQKAVVAEALGKHEFVARDVVEAFVAPRLVWEGEEIMFKADDGRLVAVEDGVAGLAKTRPELLKPTGTGGAGARTAGSGGGGGSSKGDLGGDRSARTAAIAARFPDLAAS